MRKFTFYTLWMLMALLMAASCASIGNPSGGPRDEDPPKFLSSTPVQGEINVSPTKAVLTFDEYITLKDAFSKVVVSPPSSQTPRVSSLGRRVTVDFRDTLLPNTTYTIDFGDAIMDNNEGNKLENFIYTFSTGPVLDTLMISGMVLGAADLEPAKGIYVGLHSNHEDSVFKKKRFERIAKTDDKGRFVIGGLPAGAYRIYALEDRDGDMAWSSPDETLAFYDAIIEPYTEESVATDTIYNLLTGKVDTVVRRERVKFLPNNILLRSFNTGFKQQYITKYERVDSTRIRLIFNAPADSLPVTDLVMPGGNSISLRDISVTERSATNDTLSFWLKDPGIIASDTLRLAVQFLRADSTYNMVATNDTLRLITQRAKPQQSKVKKENKARTDTLAPAVPTIAFKTLTSKVEVNEPFMIELPVPLESFDPAMVHLQLKRDTLWVDAEEFREDKIRFDTLNPRLMTVSYPWAYDTQYKITVDSLAGKSVYGLFTDDFTYEFKTRPESEYSTITLRLSGMKGNDPRFIQLLDGQGNPLRSKTLVGNNVIFDFLLPAKYNIRIIEDANGNGRWDPGNFDLGIQPDLSYYYPQTIELKPNWSQELDWNVFATPVDKMKPESLKKNK